MIIPRSTITRISRPMVLGLLGVALAGGCSSTISNDDNQEVTTSYPKPTFTADGMLNRPEGYRRWVYVGTPLTPNTLNPPEAAFPEFHNVYIHPDDFEEYERSGEFPDGTVIVKELALVGSEQAVSGNGFFMGEFSGLEATIKDSVRFANEPGNWAYFSFGHSYPLADEAQAFPAEACNACHQASAADDFVFTQYYPVLRAARGTAQEGGGVSMSADDARFEALGARMSAATESVTEAQAPTGVVESPVPTDRDALYRYLVSGGYREFQAQESSTHPSRGPHTKVGLPVRVFMDPSLDASLREGRLSHPAGAAVIKEMFDDAGELAGWATMVKTQPDSEGGEGWFWYELASTEDVAPVASGNGVPLCFGCHVTGDDYILSTYPLR